MRLSSARHMLTSIRSPAWEFGRFVLEKPGIPVASAFPEMTLGMASEDFCSRSPLPAALVGAQ